MYIVIFYKKFNNRRANRYELCSVICKIFTIMGLMACLLGGMAYSEDDPVGLGLIIGGIISIALLITFAILFRRKANAIMETEGPDENQKPSKSMVFRYIICIVIFIAIGIFLHMYLE